MKLQFLDCLKVSEITFSFGCVDVENGEGDVLKRRLETDEDCWCLSELGRGSCPADYSLAAATTVTQHQCPVTADEVPADLHHMAKLIIQAAGVV